MKTRLTPEELAKSHHGLCAVSIGDGACSCVVHWVEAHQKELDAKDRQIEDAEKCVNDLQDLLAEQPLDSFRPLVISGRAHLGTYRLKYKVKPECEKHQWGVDPKRGPGSYCKNCGKVWLPE